MSRPDPAKCASTSPAALAATARPRSRRSRKRQDAALNAMRDEVLRAALRVRKIGLLKSWRGRRGLLALPQPGDVDFDAVMAWLDTDAPFPPPGPYGDLPDRWAGSGHPDDYNRKLFAP